MLIFYLQHSEKEYFAYILLAQAKTSLKKEAHLPKRKEAKYSIFTKYVKLSASGRPILVIE
ncbi:hypothetical protein CMK13_01365 [Candidatus Poribacteria bacterium]|nr:hypothetical protein [Candidatus Poribacteria bacterium]OUT67393.1 MAG: hypothetical protein CBB75_01155 [bacterium TMED15]